MGIKQLGLVWVVYCKQKYSMRKSVCKIKYKKGVLFIGLIKLNSAYSEKLNPMSKLFPLKLF